LADPLPQGKALSFIKDLLLRAPNKAVGLHLLITQLEANSLQIDMHVANAVLSGVEGKLRSDLEEKFGQKHWEINSEILKETILVLRDPNRTREMLNEAGYSSKGVKNKEPSQTLEILNSDIVIERIEKKESLMER
jgi:hypothetical protein